MRPLLRRATAAFLAAALSSTGAGAQDSGDCPSAYEQTQVLRRSGRLLEARASAIKCSAQTCPQVLAKDCARWVADIEPAIPRVVLSVKDASGAPLEGATIYLDGKRVTGTTAGQSIEVDPGEHVLRFEYAAEKPIEKRALFVEGEKNHRVVVSFGEAQSSGRPSTTPVKEPRSSQVLAAWIAAGVSVAALATSAVFGVRALEQRSKLERAQCKPRCNPEDVLALQRSAALSDISAAAAIVAAGGAVYLFLSAPDVPTTRPPTVAQGRRHGVGLVWSQSF